MLPLSLLLLFYSGRPTVLQIAISSIVVIGKDLEAKGGMAVCVCMIFLGNQNILQVRERSFCISIIPLHVEMKQINRIILYTQLLTLLINLSELVQRVALALLDEGVQKL